MFDDSSLSLEVATSRLFRLISPLQYTGKQETFIVPAGFVTDLATVPQVFQWLVDDHGAYTQAAVLHDWLCIEAHAGRLSRRDADGLFRRVLREENVAWLRRWLMWAGVRAGGRFAGGMSWKEVGQFVALMPVAVCVLVLTIPPLLGRALVAGVDVLS